MQNMLNINQLITLSREASTVLHKTSEGSEVIQIHEHAGIRWAYCGGESLVSAFRPEAPYELVFPNHHSMLCSLLICELPKSVLNLGFGLGAFERYFAHYLPALNVVSVDTSPAMVELSRTWFDIPKSQPVVIEPAYKHLCSSQHKYSVILCDIFSGDLHSGSVFESQFYAAIAQCLNENGVLAINLSPTSEQEFLKILMPVRDAFPYVLLSTITDQDNVVLLTSREPLPSIAELKLRAQRRGNTMGFDISAAMAQYIPLPQRKKLCS